jgi:hypothetical protein
MRTKTLVMTAIVVLSGCSKPTFGPGFEGEITMHTQSPGKPGSDLLVKTKGDKLRFEVKTGGADAYTVRDPATGKLVTVMDSTKSYMEMDFSKPTAQPSTNPDTATVTKSGKHETVAGADCEDWTATDASGKKSEVCVAQGVYVDLGSVSGKADVSKDLKEKKYFPLRNVDYDAKGNELSRTEVTKIEKKSLDDSQFTVPAGYAKVDVSSLMGPK